MSEIKYFPLGPYSEVKFVFLVIQTLIDRDLYKEIDLILEEIPIKECSPGFLLSLLAETLEIKEKLIYRPRFYQEIKEFLTKNDGNIVSELKSLE